MVSIMARPKKYPTSPVRLRTNIIAIARKKAKKKGMSLPDYLAWRLSK